LRSSPVELISPAVAQTPPDSRAGQAQYDAGAGDTGHGELLQQDLEPVVEVTVVTTSPSRP